jgi:hypothetical protein
MGRVAVLCALALVIRAPEAAAVESSPSMPSTFSGNGHSLSFDGRLFITRQHLGWMAHLLRPEAITYRADGFPNARGPMWTKGALILTGPDPEQLSANWLALCEADRDRAPYRCDLDGARSASGAYDCYDLWVIDSDPKRPLEIGGPEFQRRRLLLWVSDPKSAQAEVLKWQWEAIEPMTPTLRGIEPTVTADGRLMVYQGHPANDGEIDTLVYVTNPQPCAAGGWSAPRSLSRMASDPAVLGRYRLAERTLRAADGTPFADGDLVFGAYPWLFPDGDAVVFTAARMPCRGAEDPPGCGSRRNALAVLGYPTNWGIAIVDGGVNPSTTDISRLFFSSPGPSTFPGLPVTPGADVWPFFGSNTENYVELSFDDGLDGNYGGFWHLNESVDHAGNLDRTRSPDVSGYFNTAVVPLSRIPRNLLGAPLELDGSGSGHSIPDDPSHRPADRLSVELELRLDADPNCDDRNNFRFLVEKGRQFTGGYSMVLEDDGRVQARVNVVGDKEYFVLSDRPLPVGVLGRIGMSYEPATGDLAFYSDGVETVRKRHPPAAVAYTTEPLRVGGPEHEALSCPEGAGAFHGVIEKLDVSDRDLTPGARFPAANNGVLGKAVELDGRTGRLVVPHATSLNPVNAITLSMAVKPASNPDCDDRDNWRLLLGKGDAYSLILLEDGRVRGSVGVTGGASYAIDSERALPMGVWSRIALTYDASTGSLAFFVDGQETGRSGHPPAPLAGSSDDLTIGGPAEERTACPDGQGAFHGAIDEVSVSRVVRAIGPPPTPMPPVPDAGVSSPPDAAVPGPDASPGDPGGPGLDGDGRGGGGCSALPGAFAAGAGSLAAQGALLLALLLLARARRRR